MSAPDRFLLVHNYYQQPGGEDSAFAAEVGLLRSRGHDVATYTVHNDRITGMRRLSLAKATIWNSSAYQELSKELRRQRPRVVHFHNTFPLISPAAYAAARQAGVPVVQTLHNFRLACLNGLLFRDGHPCEDCLGRLPLPGVAHACYRNDRAASGVVAAMVVAHRMRRTWTRLVDRYIALSENGLEKFVAAGLPREKLAIKPNFVLDDPGTGQHDGGYALYVGRLSTEKGIETVVDAWQRMGPSAPRLLLVGDGPLRDTIRLSAERLPRVTFLGHRSHAEVTMLMLAAQMLIFPSVCYEGFGMVIAEAFAAGLPVVASNLGSAASLIRHGGNGLHFRAGDAAELQAKVEWACAHPVQLAAMGHAARADYESMYCADANYRTLMRIYAEAEAQTNGGPRLRSAIAAGSWESRRS